MGRRKPGIKPSQGPNQGKRILSHEVHAEGSTNHLKPEFNLEYLGGDFCLSHCTKEEKGQFADRLHQLGGMTWKMIAEAHRHGSGCEEIPRHALGNRRFPDEMTDDVKLLAFRFSGMKPMVGYRRGRTFVILFLDRNFTLYKH